jgi:hypothetical protein
MKGSFFGSNVERKGGSDRWNKDSEAGKLLKSLLEKGDIDPSDSPKSIWVNYPIFQQYDLSKFRAALNKLKSEMGCNLRLKKVDLDDDVGVSTGGTGGGGGGYAGSLGGGGAGMGCNGGGGAYAGDFDDEIIGRENRGWMPIHTIFEWCDSHLRNRITLLVVMPAGVNHKYSLAVVGGGTKLEIVVKWPEELVDAEKLHEPFKKMMESKKSYGLDGSVQDHMARVQQFSLHINALERKMDRFESKCTIDLPRTVHAHQVETNPFGWKGEGSRILYINLVCECTDSNKQKGSDFFII